MHPTPRLACFSQANSCQCLWVSTLGLLDFREDPTLLPPRGVNTHLLFSACPMSPAQQSLSSLDNSFLSLQLKGEDLDCDGFSSVLLVFMSVPISPEPYGGCTGRPASSQLLLSLLGIVHARVYSSHSPISLQLPQL